jgi:hypothetical protein
MSTNPFEDASSAQPVAPQRRRNRPRPAQALDQDAEPAIWAARHVEWPIPTSLSLANYQKLVKQTRQLSVSMGMEGDVSMEVSEEDEKETSYFSGFMNRVLNTKEDEMSDEEMIPHAETGTRRPLRSPRPNCVATANSWMVAALECPGVSGSPSLRLVSRWNVRRMSGVDQWMTLPLPVGKDDSKVMHVLCDPTGCHTLISAKNGEAYYHHSSTKTLQKLQGFGRNPDGSWPKELTGIPATASGKMIQSGLSKGAYITAVAWDKERGTEGSTKTILLGTNLGEIYEYSLHSPNATDPPEEKHGRPLLLHQLNVDAAVTGLALERLRTGLLVMVCTSGISKRTRLYTFYSQHSSSFRMVLSDEAHASLVELPGSIETTNLQICNDHICMRTATGIYYGTIDRTQSGPTFAPGGSMIIESGILPFHSSSSQKRQHDDNIPVSLALTPHHVITLSESNEVRFWNRVCQNVIQQEKVDWVSASSVELAESMASAELLMDVRRPDQVWLRKARSLVHISSSQEDRDVWKYTLFKCLEMPTGRRTSPGKMTDEEKAQEALFEHAKSLCTNPSQKAVLTRVRAEYHLNQGRAELGAKYLAQCPSILAPFADTAVRLALPSMLNLENGNSYSPQAKEALQSNLPLITYLCDKMRVSKNNNDKMTCTMIGAWLTELYLHEFIGEEKNSQLQNFLSQNINSMDPKVIVKLLASHNVGASQCATYANLSGDIATAVAAALRSGDSNGVANALRILNEAPFELAEPLYYKHASSLLQRAPVLAGKSFLSRYTHGLSPTRLLPSIMYYERMRSNRANAMKQQQQQQQKSQKIVEESKTSSQFGKDMFGSGVDATILSTTGSFIDDPDTCSRYLEGVIKLGCKSSAISSFLISIYVRLDNEEPLFKFLSTHVSSTESKKSSSVDMSYALRTILATGRHFRSAIKLYMGFGMRQQAVELALKVDPSLARELAQDSIELEERKRLWLMIAKQSASEGLSAVDSNVVAKVVSVLKDCGPDVLSIEDVLPFL